MKASEAREEADKYNENRQEIFCANNYYLCNDKVFPLNNIEYYQIEKDIMYFSEVMGRYDYEIEGKIKNDYIIKLIEEGYNVFLYLYTLSDSIDNKDQYLYIKIKTIIDWSCANTNGDFYEAWDFRQFMHEKYKKYNILQLFLHRKEIVDFYQPILQERYNNIYGHTFKDARDIIIDYEMLTENLLKYVVKDSKVYYEIKVPLFDEFEESYKTELIEVKE